jgi:hypothetical protein
MSLTLPTFSFAGLVTFAPITLSARTCPGCCSLMIASPVATWPVLESLVVTVFAGVLPVSLLPVAVVPVAVEPLVPLVVLLVALDPVLPVAVLLVADCPVLSAAAPPLVVDPVLPVVDCPDCVADWLVSVEVPLWLVEGTVVA